MTLLLLLCAFHGSCEWAAHTYNFTPRQGPAVSYVNRELCEAAGRHFIVSHGGAYPHLTTPRYEVRDFRCKP